MNVAVWFAFSDIWVWGLLLFCFALSSFEFVLIVL